jgi:hypothetical protein
MDDMREQGKTLYIEGRLQGVIPNAGFQRTTDLNGLQGAERVWGHRGIAGKRQGR